MSARYARQGADGRVAEDPEQCHLGYSALKMPCAPHSSSERFASIVHASIVVDDLSTQAFAATDLRYKRLRLCPSTQGQYKADEGAEIRASTITIRESGTLES